MGKQTKAFLASTFVFPGVGQLLLKRRLSTAAFAATALSAIFVILSYVVNTAMTISERVISAEIELNIFVIRKLILDQHANSNIPSVNIATWILIAVWLISTLDAYRAGNARAKAANSIKKINTRE